MTKPTARELAHQHRIRAALDAASKRGERIAIGDPIDLIPTTTSMPIRRNAERGARTMTITRTNLRVQAATLSTPGSSTEAPGAYEPPANPEVALEDVRKALELPAEASEDDFRSALEAVLASVYSASPGDTEAMGRRLGLSAREIRMCLEMKCDVRRYAASRAAMKKARSTR